MRLTPSLGFVLLFIFAAGEYFTPLGPYPVVDNLVNPCRKYWWSYLLHVQVQANNTELVSSNLNLNDQKVDFLHFQCLVNFC